MANSTNNTRRTGGSSDNRKMNGQRKANTTNRNTGNRNTSSRNSTNRNAGNKNAAQRSSTGRSNGSRNSAGRDTMVDRNSATRNTSAMTNSAMSKKKQKQQKVKKYLLIGEIVLAVVLLIGGVIYFQKSKGNTVETGADDYTETVGVKVDGIDISSMTKEQAKQTLLAKYPWNFTITYEGKVYQVENLFEKEIDAVLYDAYAPNAQKEYKIAITEPKNKAAEIAKNVSDMWSQPAVDAAITGYNSETEEFVLSDSQPGHIVDVEQLTADVFKELAAANYNVNVQAKGESTQPTFEKDDYQILGTYETTTTNNENRNTNVRLASEAICGTILQPQEQFSYNGILGKRTADKGYKEASAYANGEVVQELGGGICQVSSTLYNATIFANLQIDKRTGHTYEPSYVTPGEDAAVSFENPDFVFTNNTGATLGIKSTFVDRKVKVTIFGISTLDEGVKRYMKSEKVSDIAPPADVLVEDPMLLPGQTQVVSGPQNGSKWATYIILEKDGEIISEEYLHTTTYRGKGGEIHVNTTGIVDPAVFAAQLQAQQEAQRQAEAAAAQQAAQQQPAPEAPPAEVPPVATPPAQ